MKRVLIISYIFPPMVAGGAPRIAQFAKYLPEQGWQPTVLTVEDPGMVTPDQQTVQSLPEQVQIARAYCPLSRAGSRGTPNPKHGLWGYLRNTARYLMRLLLFPDRQILWYPWAVRTGKQLLDREKYDVILATCGPGTNLLIGKRLAKYANVPLVVDFRDLWGDYPYNVFATPFHQKWTQHQERTITNYARKVIGVSPQMADHLADRNKLPQDKTVSITNGYDPDTLPLAEDRRDLNDGDRPFRLVYTGSVYGAYDFGPFFRAVRSLADAGEITPSSFRVQFVGNLSPDVPQHWGVAPFVEIEKPVGHGRVFEFLGKADALLMMEGIGYWGQFSYAVKVFDYLLTGKPILAMVEPQGNTARLVEQAGVGVVCSPEEESSIADNLRKLISQKEKPARSVDLTADPLCHFDRRRLTGQLNLVLNEAAGVLE